MMKLNLNLIQLKWAQFFIVIWCMGQGTGVMAFRECTVDQKVKNMKRETKSAVRSSQRDLGRELASLERDEKKLTNDLKAAAKRGATKLELNTLAKQLVRLRSSKEKLSKSRSQIGSLNTTATLMGSTVKMASVMGSTVKTMGVMNKALNPGKMQTQMMDFQRSTAEMDMKSEMMDDTLASAFDDEGVNEEADAVALQVLDELGVQVGSQLQTAPTAKVSALTKQGGHQEETEGEKDLEERLKKLLRE